MSTKAFIAAALALADEEKAEARVDLSDGLFSRQLEVWHDPERVKCVLAGRRGGKSNTAVPWLVEGAQQHSGTVNPYISITRKHAKLNFWPLVKAVCKLAEPDCRINEAELTVTFSNDSIVVLGGADKINELEKYRGMKTARAVVDECGAYPSESLKYLIEDVLEPATMDVRGMILMVGTPGPTMEGYWFDITGPHAVGDIPVYRWDARDNPYIPHAEAELEDVLRRRGWSWDNATFRREYLAEWCEDTGELVFPVTERNHIEELPTRAANGAEINHTAWRYVIGIDVGYVDATALVVLAAHPQLPEDYVVSAEKHRRWLVDELAARVGELREEYAGAACVIDTGGMGKIHAEELRRRYGMPLIPAEKRERESRVRLARDRIIAGRTLFVLPGCQPLLSETAVMGWDKDKRLPNPDAEDHATDAFLYAFGHLHNYVHKTPGIKPKYGTKAYFDEEAKRLLEERVNKYTNNQGRTPWRQVH